MVSPKCKFKKEDKVWFGDLLCDVVGLQPTPLPNGVILFAYNLHHIQKGFILAREEDLIKENGI